MTDQRAYYYTVPLEHRCEGLKKYPDNKIFEGIVQYSNFYKEFYLTTDGVTYTSVHHAENITPIHESFGIKSNKYKKILSFVKELSDESIYERYENLNELNWSAFNLLKELGELE
jgi:hypothetical protein